MRLSINRVTKFNSLWASLIFYLQYTTDDNFCPLWLRELGEEINVLSINALKFKQQNKVQGFLSANPGK